MAQLTTLYTDNRDDRTTTLVLSSGDAVTVDPIWLLQNMLQNQDEASDEDTSWLDDLQDLVRAESSRIQAPID